MSGTLRLTEIFYSIQGESRTAGIPTVFIRLSGCPLRCTYCDTPYAFKGGDLLSIDDILCRAARFGCRYVTVTGGEPLAQKGCLALLKELAGEGYEVSLETSGVLDIAEVDPRVSRVMDLKTPGSGEVGKNRFENIQHLNRNDQLKFVICDRPDYDWAREQIAHWRLADRCEILVSPAAGQQEARELAEWVLVDRLPVRFQIQLHRLLWGEEKGR
ncbi:MAG: 7-carboxy-7-deazaguanine synthase QueE [Gammaproteobacteria bacterium RIFOXYA12_FULL_61_12]|nr:MAG: 7-carboxy-7-deazaguanine synthase QueE [Gammaproteobacteria bacterium RIFOXYD12_FULL_61_37]OGT93859.1 MAG: 7-carboxy-7-deazaguanine synthase QueE [Gammaproteobacteria bacterium RIFOXYA12_FULL_61_12]